MHVRIRETQGAYRLWVLDKRLRHTHLPFLARNASVDQNPFAARLRVALPDVVTSVRRCWRKQIEALDHLLECVSVRETCTTNTDILLETEVFDLVQDRLRIILARATVLVGLDRTDIRRLRAHQVVDEGSRGGLQKHSQDSQTSYWVNHKP